MTWPTSSGALINVPRSFLHHRLTNTSKQMLTEMGTLALRCSPHGAHHFAYAFAFERGYAQPLTCTGDGLSLLITDYII